MVGGWKATFERKVHGRVQSIERKEALIVQFDLDLSLWGADLHGLTEVHVVYLVCVLQWRCDSGIQW